jgi:hypothetical protein
MLHLQNNACNLIPFYPHWFFCSGCTNLKKFAQFAAAVLRANVTPAFNGYMALKQRDRIVLSGSGHVWREVINGPGLA